MKLKEYRQKACLTQSEIAQKLNMSTRGYISWETGRTQPNIEALIKLSDFFHTTVDNLISHNVPYLLDKSTLTQKQRNLVELISQLDDHLCDLTEAYIYGKIEGRDDHLATIEKIKRRF